MHALASLRMTWSCSYCQEWIAKVLIYILFSRWQQMLKKVLTKTNKQGRIISCTVFFSYWMRQGKILRGNDYTKTRREKYYVLMHTVIFSTLFTYCSTCDQPVAVRGPSHPCYTLAMLTKTTIALTLQKLWFENLWMSAAKLHVLIGERNEYTGTFTSLSTQILQFTHHITN